MVFESIVADILNRYLGEYVENLDKGQLKIGIWGGKQTKNIWFLPPWKIKQKENRFFSSLTHYSLFTIFEQ